MQAVPGIMRTAAAVAAVEGDDRQRCSRSAAAAALCYSSPVRQVVDKSTGHPQSTVPAGRR